MSTSKSSSTTDLCGLMSKNLNKEIKEYYCGLCKQTFCDKDAHVKLVHDRNLSGMSRDGQKLLQHCPVCLPDPKFFANQDALHNHFIDLHHNKSA